MDISRIRLKIISRLKSYSQAGQDLFVMSLFEKGYHGTFVDVGCQLPDTINNTYLLEKNGWSGLSLDIIDYSKEWAKRKSKFVCGDALTSDFRKLFEDAGLPGTIDYLNVDIEGEGLRYKALENVMASGHAFKVITIEHDAYRGYALTEREPQRKLLNSMGYLLLCGDVVNGNRPYEDWWINPVYFKESEYMHYKCSNTHHIDILKKRI